MSAGDGAPPDGHLLLYTCRCGLTLTTTPGVLLECCAASDRAAQGPDDEAEPEPDAGGSSV